MAKKKTNAPRFVMIYHDMLWDPDFIKLSNSAKVVYFYMREKFNYKTLNEVSLTYTEMKDVVSTRTMYRALEELQKIGFIVKIKKGGLSYGTYRNVAKYKFNGKFKEYYYRGFKV